jgi:hypothetical protein
MTHKKENHSRLKFGEADPGGLGACPQGNTQQFPGVFIVNMLFSGPKLGEADPGGPGHAAGWGHC